MDQPLIEEASVAPAGAVATIDIPEQNEVSSSEVAELLDATGPDGLDTSEANERLREYGYNELASNETHPLLIFLGYFWGPMPCMIWLAMIMELAQALNGENDKWLDFGVLLGLQIINGTVAFFEEKNAGDAIAALKASLAPKAFCKRDGVWNLLPARELVPGDRINLKLGAIIPADCVLEKDGKPLEIDQAALTGESLPVTVHPGGNVLMGSTVVRGELEALVAATGARTFFGKAAEMVSKVENQGRFQRVLFQVMMSLLAIALVLVIIILGVLLKDNDDGKNGVLDAIGIAVVILVASIPIAMQVVATVTMAVGARDLAGKKAIVARLSAIEELAGLEVLCSDKTGTLTLNKLTLYDPVVVDASCNADDLIFYGALAAKRMEEGQDAIDFCITRAAEQAGRGAELDDHDELDFLPFDPIIKRTEATVKRHSDGMVYKVTKGAPQIILKLCEADAASDPNWADKHSRAMAAVEDLASRGYRALGVARTQPADTDKDSTWEFLGVLSLFDPPRADTARTIERAQDMGVEVKMITGDHTTIAKETARRLGMGDRIYNTSALRGDNGEGTADPEVMRVIRSADGFAEVMPEHKYGIVGRLQEQRLTVGMTGDGVNDAPALKKAQIGIAVEGATDAARAAADIVLTEPGLSVIIDAMILSRQIFQRVRNYCIFRIGGTVQLIFFFFIAIFFNPKNNSDFECPASVKDNYCSPSAPNFGDEPPYCTCESHVYLPVISIVLITIINDACVLAIARDTVVANKTPQHWNLPEIFVVSSVLGVVAMVGTLLLMLMGLRWTDGFQHAVFFKDYDTGNKVSEGSFEYEEMLSMLYLKLSLTDIMTVFSARTRGFFFARKPANMLMAAFLVATAASTLISTTSSIQGLKNISWYTAGLVWVYSIVWFVLQDICKVVTYRILAFFDSETKLSNAADAPSEELPRRRQGETLQRIRRSRTFHQRDEDAPKRWTRSTSEAEKVVLSSFQRKYAPAAKKSA